MFENSGSDVTTTDDVRYKTDFIYDYVFRFIFRCKIPECDVGNENRDIGYDQIWVKYAIPKSRDEFEKCVRFAPNKTAVPFDEEELAFQQCSREQFDTSKQIQCSEFIYRTDETNVQTEVRLNVNSK